MTTQMEDGWERRESEPHPSCKTPDGCRENGCLGWCDEHKPEVATRCEGCAELRDQLRDLTRQSNLDAMRVGKLAGDVERYSALHARLFAEKTAAQIELEGLREALFRLWPAVEKAMAGLVFTADRAGEVQADMNTLRASLKTPNV